jgi:DNA-binding IclR family transcriptional regulator
LRILDSGVKSADRALSILVFLASRVLPTGAATIARECGLPRSSTYALLRAMHGKRFLSYSRELKAWSIGEAVTELGIAYLRSQPLERLARPHLERLTATVGQTSHVAVLHGTDAMSLVVERPPEGTPVPVTQVGVRIPACFCAVGKAILMHLSEEQLDALYPVWRPEVRLDRNGLLRFSALREELEAARRLGYAVNAEATMRGVTCIAAPVLSSEGEPVAALGITFLSASTEADERQWLAEEVCSASRALAADQGADPTPSTQPSLEHAGVSSG